jgi:D-alanyl-lipoteichoic acid acyltransferase DltB (MBOAT superfamily)
MEIQVILLFVLAALAIRLVNGGPLRLWLLSAVNVAVIYVLQPQVPIRYMNFWLPTLTIFITVSSWVLVTPPAERYWKRSLPMLLFLAAAALLMTLSRYLDIDFSILASRPPNLSQAALILAAAALLLALSIRFARGTSPLLSAAVILLLGLFIVLKVPALALEASRLLRGVMGQTPTLATAVDLRWLGFSYLAFRLIHTLRDRALGRLPVVGLQEYFIYVVFFPTISAGPIDRLDRFITDLCSPTPRDTYWEDALEGGRRVFIGVFKKFVVADTLALISINASNIEQVVNNGWLWALLYAYAFQIFFDFSGYSDIAIGLGRMLGIRVPENFHAPYLKPSLGQFWNNWHITLTQWIRAYYFNPLTRWLRSSKNRLPAVLVLLVGQVTTMLLIGLWHGVTLNFLIWGLWHGVGSFLENRWGIVSRPFLDRLSENRFARLALTGISVLLTFNYVSLGWLWFALPEPGQAVHTLLRLFGFT